MNKSTGLLPDRHETRVRDALHQNFRDAALGAPTSDFSMQPVPWIRDQLTFPSCVGQALAACIDAARGVEPWASAVSLWREARRRQGSIEDILSGTRFEYAIAGLESRGWDPYRDGEDRDNEEAGLDAPPAGDDLADELFAYDKRSKGLTRYRISESGAELLDAVDAALENDFGVVFGTGVRDPYFAYMGSPSGPDELLDNRHLGGDANGHAQRVFGTAHVDGRKVYYVQNSWGYWGGCHSPTGLWMPGCCVVHPVVLTDCWDIHVVQVRE